MAHACRWPGCSEQTTDRLWSCRAHWYTLPTHLRDKLWARYQSKQWVTGNLSLEYVEAERMTHEWIVENTFPEDRGEQPKSRSPA